MTFWNPGGRARINPHFRAFITPPSTPLNGSFIIILFYRPWTLNVKLWRCTRVPHSKATLGFLFAAVSSSANPIPLLLFINKLLSYALSDGTGRLLGDFNRYLFFSTFTVTKIIYFFTKPFNTADRFDLNSFRVGKHVIAPRCCILSQNRVVIIRRLQWLEGCRFQLHYH